MTQTEILEKLGERPKCFACKNGLAGETKQCYACAHDLTGKPKPSSFESFDDDDYLDDDNEWECRCTTWTCRCDEVKKSEWLFYCPFCEGWLNQSKHLREALRDPKVRWLANMVAHYRHDHRKWDSQHEYISAHVFDGEAVYERQKALVNNQIKRQIIRKATALLLAQGFTPDDFQALQNTEQQTIELARKRLGNEANRRG